MISDNPRMKSNALVIVVLAAALIAGFFTARALVAPPDGPPQTDAIVLAQPRDPGAFALVDHHGEPFTPASVRGGWTLWFFGFTHCPDVCPMTLSTLNHMDRMLADTTVRPQVVMVSVDPARDTPEKLAEYVPYFNERFVGVTGSPGEIRQLTERLGILVRYAAQQGDDYTVDHGAALMLSGPDGVVRAVFQSPHEPQALANELLALIPWFERQS